MSNLTQKQAGWTASSNSTTAATNSNKKPISKSLTISSISNQKEARIM